MPVSRPSSHLAAISPYFNIFKQPAVPVSNKVLAAAYLFRHGIIEVSGHDYHAYIAPFLRRLYQLQRASGARFTGPLSFLNTYRSWITEAHVGTLNDQGMRQSRDLGAAFRVRYKQWLPERGTKAPASAPAPIARMTVMTDSAARCRVTAQEFAGSFAKDREAEDDYQGFDVSVVSIDAGKERDPRRNLSWHTTYKEVDQTCGHEWMGNCMKITAAAALSRLDSFWPGELTPEDVYSMQLLHCYDTCSGRPSPWMQPKELFTQRDWKYFEYLRDGKYFFSEGYGSSRPTARYALPWLVYAVDFLRHFKTEYEQSQRTGEHHCLRHLERRGFRVCGPQDSDPSLEEPLCKPQFPLKICFTHREEVLYLCSLFHLGRYVRTDSTLKEDQGQLRLWSPSTSPGHVQLDRPWHVSTMACYLGHVGLEAYVAEDASEMRQSEHLNKQIGGQPRQEGSGVVRIRIILNGDVVDDAFLNGSDKGGLNMQPDADGGYGWEVFEDMINRKRKMWQDKPPIGLEGNSCSWSEQDEETV